MSSIDKRVVEMEFDNRQFERGVRDTITSLEALSKSLLLADAARGLDDLKAASRDFNISAIADSLENISSKFSIMGAVGLSVIKNLVDSAMDYASKLTNMIFDPLVAGGQRRALNIEQAKFQFRGLSMDVERAMSDALYAVQDTAYGLDEAARAASQLGASQIELGDNMRQALRGISGVAAMTNSSYEDTSRVFTKVAGQGRLMGDDLNSLASRGLNAAATLGEAFGKTEAEIRAMVTEGEISFEMFASAMDDAFGPNAAKANETYTGSLSNMRAALARIGARFFTPWLEQQRDLFNALTPAIDSVAEALKPVIDRFSQFTGARTRGLIDFINGLDLSRLYLIFSPLMAIVRNTLTAIGTMTEPIKEAFRDIFPPTSLDRINEILKGVQAFTAGLKMGAEGSENLRRTFAGVFAVFSIGWTVLKQFIGFLGDLFGMTSIGSGGFLEATASIGDFLVRLKSVVDEGSALTDFFNTSRVNAWKLIEVITDLKDRFLAIFGLGTGEFSSLFDGLEDAVDIGEAFTAVWDGVIKILQTVGDIIIGVSKHAFSFLRELPSTVLDYFAAIDWALVLSSINTGLFAGFIVVLNDLGNIFSTGVGRDIFGNVNDFMEQLKGPFEAASGALDELTGTLSTMQGTLRATKLVQIAMAVGILAWAVTALSKIDAAGLTRALSAIATLFVQLMAGLMVIERMNIMSFLQTAASIVVLAIGIRILASSVIALSELNWDELARGLSGFAVVLGAVVLAAKGLSGNQANMVKIGVGLTILAVGIRILASSVTALSDLGWEDMARGLVGVAALLAAVVIAANTMPSMFTSGLVKTGAALLILAVGIKILASAVTELSGLSWEDMAKGLVGVGTLLAGLVIFANLVSDTTGLVKAGAGILIVSIAMKILASAIGDFSGMSWEEMAKGLVGLGIALVGIVTMLKSMPPSTMGSAVALVAVSAALVLMAGAIRMIGGMDWDEIAGGLMGLGAMLGLIVIALNAMQGTILGAAALLIVAAALSVLAPVLYLLSGLSWSDIGKGLVVLAAAFAILAAAGYALSPVVPTFLGLGAAFLMLSGGVALLGVGLDLIARAIERIISVGDDALVTFTALVNTMVTLMPTIAEGMAQGFITFMVALADGIDSLMVAITRILQSILQTVIDLVPDILELVLELATGIIDVLIELVPEATELFILLARSLLEVAMELVPEMAETTLAIMLAILTTMVDYVPQIVEQMILLVVAILEELAAGVPDMATAATELMVAFLESIADNLGDVIAAGTEIIVELIQGISDSAVTIVNAGMEAVISFLEGITTAIENNAGRFRTAGIDMAIAIADGLTGGLASRVGGIFQSAAELGRSAIGGAADALGMQSPSKEFIKIGEAVGDGFIIGLVGKTDEVTKTWDNMTGLLKNASESSAEEVEKLQKKLDKLYDAKKRDNEAIKETAAALKQATFEYSTTTSALDQMNAGLEDQRSTLVDLSSKYEFYTTKLEAAESKLKDIIQTRMAYRDSVTGQFDDLPRIGEETTLDEYISDLGESNAKLIEFGNVMKEIRELGLSDALYEEFMKAGPAIQPFLEELLDGGVASVEILNKMSEDLDRTATRLGYTAARELYKAGQDAAQGLVDGLESKRSAVEAEMAEIAKLIQEIIQMQLQINSPSKVMQKLGEFTGQGLADGMKKSAPVIKKAAEGMGDDTIEAMKRSISGLSDLLAMDTDLNPTITPVLDLTAFHKDAAQISSTLSGQMIDIDSAYMKAKNASSKYQANEAARHVTTTAEDISPPAALTFIQNNTSPKALSSAEIYRQTKNQLSVTKGALTPNVAQDA